MELVFCCQAVFQYSKGKYYSTNASFGMQLWDRYLKHFEHITIVARVENTEYPDEFELNNEKISFIPLPRYKGLVKAVQSLHTINRTLTPLAIPGRAYILRVPGVIGSTFASILRKKHVPYAVEVVGDPWDVMESIGGNLAFILKRVGFYMLRKTVANADVALYVTKSKLQNRYPISETATAFAASDVLIEKSDFANTAKKYPQRKECFDFLAVGSLEQLYKAPDIVIKAIAKLKNEGINTTIHWLGGGCFQEEMETLALELGVTENVLFYGNVDRKIVHSKLESADLFIHVSRTEGLPRAIVEAMAKGLPVIGSNVGGIPELLDKDAIVEPDDVDGLVDKIKEFINNPDFYHDQSKRNLEESRLYEDTTLATIRSKYFEHIKLYFAI